MDMKCHPTLYNGCNLKLIHVRYRGLRFVEIYLKEIATPLINNIIWGGVRVKQKYIQGSCQLLQFSSQTHGLFHSSFSVAVHTLKMYFLGKSYLSFAMTSNFKTISWNFHISIIMCMLKQACFIEFWAPGENVLDTGCRTPRIKRIA